MQHIALVVSRVRGQTARHVKPFAVTSQHQRRRARRPAARWPSGKKKTFYRKRSPADEGRRSAPNLIAGSNFNAVGRFTGSRARSSYTPSVLNSCLYSVYAFNSRPVNAQVVMVFSSINMTTEMDEAAPSTSCFLFCIGYKAVPGERSSWSKPKCCSLSFDAFEGRTCF